MDEKIKMQSKWGCLFVIIAILLTPLDIMLQAYTALTLYGWFLSAYFTLPSLSLAATYGIIMLIRFLTGKLSYVKSAETDELKAFVTAMLYPFMVSLGTLLLGWIVHLFL